MRFAPTQLGNLDVTVQIDNDDTDENPYDFKLRGRSEEPPEIAVLGNGLVITNGTSVTQLANNTAFGALDIVTGSVTNTFFITNSGLGSLQLNQPGHITGPAAGDFSFAVDVTNAVIANFAAAFQVRFDPTTTGLRNAFLVITNNDLDENPYTFAITGFGTDGSEIEVLGNNLAIASGTTNTSTTNFTDFGTADIGTGMVTNSFTITNFGTTNLIISPPLGFSGTGSNDFSVIAAPTTNIAPGASSSFSVRFDPMEFGNRTVTLVITNSDSDENPYTFDLSGTGTATPPAITVQPKSQSTNALRLVTFSVTASSDIPLAYQWLKNGSNIAGANNTTLLLNSVTTNDAGNYQVIIANFVGSVTSAPASLTVGRLGSIVSWTNPAPIIYGTLLGTNQLNATANNPGSFVYTPTNGTILPVGTNFVSVTFLPNNPAVYHGPTNSIRQINVNRAPLLITADDKTREIGLTNPVLTATYTGFVNGETNNILISQPVLSTIADTNSAVGSYPITVSGGAATNYSITHSNGTLSVFANPPLISQQPLSISTNALESVAFNVTVSGSVPLTYQWLFNGSSITNATNASLALNSVTTNETGSYQIIITNIAGSVTSSVANLTVFQLGSLVTWTNPAAITYGTPLGTNQLNANANNPGTFNYSLTNGAVLPAGTNVLSVTFTPNDPSVYHGPTNTLRAIIVNLASLLIAADDKTREIGFTNPVLTASYTGFVNGETNNVLTSQPVLSTIADTNSTIGGYPITVSGAAGTNYSITHSNGTLTVFANPPLISQQPASVSTNALESVAFDVIATGSAPLAYQWLFNGSGITNATNASLALNGVTTNEAGNYQVIITNVAGSVTSSVANLTVVRFNSIVSWTNPAPVIYGTPLGTNHLTATANNPGTFTYSPAIGSILPAATNSLSVIFSPNDPSVYHGPTNTFQTLIVTRALLLISADNKSRIYGQGNPLLTVTYSGFVNSETSGALTTPPTITTPATVGSIPGVYPIIVSNAVAGNYTISHSNGTLTITADAPVIALQPTNQTVILSSNATFAVTVGGTPPHAFQWFFNGTNSLFGQTNDFLIQSNAQPSDAGDYTVVVTNIVGGVTSSVASLTVLLPPVITLQPTNVAVAALQSVSLSASANGTEPLSYQWLKNSVSISDALNNTLSLNNVTTNDTAAYQLVVTNLAGSITSAPAALSVSQLLSLLTWTNPAPVVYGTPLSALQTNASANVSGTFAYAPSNGFVFPAGSNLISVIFTPDDTTNYLATNASVAQLVVLAPLRIHANNKSRIYGETNPLLTVRYVGFVNGETNNVLDTQPVAATIATTNSVPGAYPITVSSATATNYSIIHSNGFLLVTADSLAITNQPTNVTILLGQTAAFSVDVAGTAPIAYQWFFNESNLLAGATNATLSLTNAQQSQYGEYFIIATNIISSVTSSVATLTVLVPPAIVQSPVNITVAPGDTAVLSVSATGFPLAYQWFFNGTNLSTATNALLSITNVQPAQAGSYFVVVTNVLGVATSSSGTVTVAAPITITSHPANKINRAGETATLSVQASSPIPLSIRWFFNSQPLNNATNLSLTISNVQRSNQGIYHAQVTNILAQAISSNAFIRVFAPTRAAFVPINIGSRTLTFVTFTDYDGNALNADFTTNFIIQASTDFQNWITLSTNGADLSLLNGSFFFQDADTSNFSRRFYRIIEK